jgi:hypothetical protein
VVVAAASGRTIGSWDHAVGIDGNDLRGKLLDIVKRQLASFEQRKPSPPREGRLR